MKTHWFVLLCLLIWATSGNAQDAGLDKRVSFSYQQARLGKVLKDISKKYDVRFTYSRDFIPVGKKMSLEVRNEPLKDALDELFAPTQIRYLAIGAQIVLNAIRVRKSGKRNRTRGLPDLWILNQGLV